MKFRVTRHVNQLKKLKDFYIDLLGCCEIARFDDNENYSGIIFGDESGCWELEFTVSDVPVTRVCDEDDLIVLYIDDESKYNKIMERCAKAKIIEFAPRNPYWEGKSKLLKDPEGNRILIVKPV